MIGIVISYIYVTINFKGLKHRRRDWTEEAEFTIIFVITTLFYPVVLLIEAVEYFKKKRV